VYKKLKNKEKSMKVYVVLKNADFTEGRGPMLLDKVFVTMELARKYVMSKDGICGSKQDYNPRVSSKSDEYYNGYQIKTVEVLEYYNNEEIEKKKKKIEELKKELEILQLELNLEI